MKLAINPLHFFVAVAPPNKKEAILSCVYKFAIASFSSWPRAMSVCAFASEECSTKLRPLSSEIRCHASELAPDFDKNANHICSKHYMRLYRKLKPRPQRPAFHHDERSLPPSPTFVLGLNPDVRAQLNYLFIFDSHISICIFPHSEIQSVPLDFFLQVPFLPVFSPRPTVADEFPVLLFTSPSIDYINMFFELTFGCVLHVGLKSALLQEPLCRCSFVALPSCN